MSLMALARNMGMTVEKRPVPVEELDSFEEAGACGTAAVITPIRKIIIPIITPFTNIAGMETRDRFPPPCYNNLIAIQNGDKEVVQLGGYP